MALPPRAARAAAAAALLLERQRKGHGPLAGFGPWMAVAVPEYRWDARHFLEMQRLLDAVTAKTIRRGYFQIPIRHGKSQHNTIGYAAYRLERDPSVRILVCSYNDRRAQKFSREIRRLFLKRGGQIATDRDAASEWETPAGGGVQAVGSGQGVASVNADLILIDDPIGSREDAESPAKRDQVWDWLTNDILARCEPHTAVLMTMSRWHQDDPAGRLMDQQKDRWTVLDLPAEAEEHDPLGREFGEPLWPEMRGEPWLQEKREELGAYGFASLLQGRPRPREGGMFKWEWWQLVEAVPTHGPMVRYWDLAGTEARRKRKGDYTVGALVCRMPDRRTAIIDIARFQLSSGARDAEIERIALMDKETYGYRVRWWIEAEVGIAGTERTAELVRRLQNVGLSVSTERPTGDKVMRAEPLAAKAEVGNVVLCPGAWRDPFRVEGASFPNGKNDDQIDAAAGADAKLVTRSTVTQQIHSY